MRRAAKSKRRCATRDRRNRFPAVMVVRPDNVQSLSAGMEHLYMRGVRRFDPSLDLWTIWTRADGTRLEEAIRRAADFWADHLPECAVSWFDEKALLLAAVPTQETRAAASDMAKSPSRPRATCILASAWWAPTSPTIRCGCPATRSTATTSWTTPNRPASWPSSAKRAPCSRCAPRPAAVAITSARAIPRGRTDCFACGTRRVIEKRPVRLSNMRS